MKIKKITAVIIVFLGFTSLAILTGCEGSDADNAAKETVEELSGKNIVDKGEKIKQQIDKLSADEIEKVQQNIKTGTYGEEQEGGSK